MGDLDSNTCEITQESRIEEEEQTDSKGSSTFKLLRTKTLERKSTTRLQSYPQRLFQICHRQLFN